MYVGRFGWFWAGGSSSTMHDVRLYAHQSVTQHVNAVCVGHARPYLIWLFIVNRILDMQRMRGCLLALRIVGWICRLSLKSENTYIQINNFAITLIFILHACSLSQLQKFALNILKAHPFYARARARVHLQRNIESIRCDECHVAHVCQKGGAGGLHQTSPEIVR